MTLDNLIGRSLERIPLDAARVLRLLEAASASIHDASLPALSNEGRFDLAYKAIVQLANAALQAKGFRTLTSRPGHHQTMLQTLPITVGIDSHTLIVKDKQNVAPSCPNPTVGARRHDGCPAHESPGSLASP